MSAKTNCEICDRPKASDSDPRRGFELCWREYDGAVGGALGDCEANRVDWRARALAAEQLAREAATNGVFQTERALAAEHLATASQAAQATLQRALAEANERANRLEAALRNVIQRIDARQPSGPRWGAEAHGDIESARAALTPRGAAERGEAFARTGDVGVLVAELPDFDADRLGWHCEKGDHDACKRRFHGFADHFGKKVPCSCACHVDLKRGGK